MTERLSTREPSRSRWLRFVAALGLIGLALCVATMSLSPSIGEPKQTTVQDVTLARNVIERVRAAQAAGSPIRLRLDNRELDALSTLAGDTSGLERVTAGVDEGVFRTRASIPFAAAMWINTEATVTGTHAGFPELRLRIGRVPLPPSTSRWFADLAHWWLGQKGVDLPAYEQLFRRFDVSRDTVSVELALPRRGGLVGHMMSAAGAPVDNRLVARIYCDLAEAGPDRAGGELEGLVRRAFRRAGQPEPVAANRAAFVALALRVVGERADPLSPSTAAVRAHCPRSPERVTLRDREDLAQHWALSAALTAVLGEQTATNLGEWKELHDSLPAGSGFSFVDLAADRSGLHVARRAMDPETAEATAQALARVSEEDLLPGTLVQAPEGLSDAEFIDRFGGVDAQRYSRAVDWIDRQLAAQNSH